MSFLPDQSTIGIALSIAGLTLAAPCTLTNRMYSRSLDLAQMLYVFSLVFIPGTTLFSDYLDYSWLSFMPSFLNFISCTTGDFICTNGYLISPAVAWTGAALLLVLLVKIFTCKTPKTKTLTFYSFWKGFSRWTMAPLVYTATQALVTSIQASNYGDNFTASINVLAYYIVLFFFELIAYKVAQR